MLCCSRGMDGRPITYRDVSNIDKDVAIARGLQLDTPSVLVTMSVVKWMDCLLAEGGHDY